MSSCQVRKAFERKFCDRALKFQIEDITETLWSTAVEFMLGNYIREDVWWATAGTAKDPVAVAEYRVLLTTVVQQNLSLVCFLVEADGSGKTLVGVNLCMPQAKGHFVDHIPPKSKAGLLSLRMFAEAMRVQAIYDKFRVDEYLMGVGLSVAPDYRGLGVATEMLTARMQLSKQRGYKATGGIFTSARAQRAAEAAGMECCYETTYEAFGKRCDIKFVTDTTCLKIFGVRTE